MDNADFLLQWNEKLKTEINKLPFLENDIRKDFLALLYDIKSCYYKEYLLLPIAQLINKGAVVVNESTRNFQKHINNIERIGLHPIYHESHFNSINRGLIIDSWSAFELSVTTFCDGICTPSELEKLLSSQYRETLTAIKKTTLHENDEATLKALLIKDHLTHVPIIRKTDFLFKKVKGYSRSPVSDKEFLRFLGKLRNTMHTNYIYYGKDYEYKFGNAIFVFKNKQRVEWHDPFAPSPKLLFYLIGQLKEIWNELAKTIEHKGFIPYPDLKQQ